MAKANILTRHPDQRLDTRGMQRPMRFVVYGRPRRRLVTHDNWHLVRYLSSCSEKGLGRGVTTTERILDCPFLGRMNREKNASKGNKSPQFTQLKNHACRERGMYRGGLI